MNVFKKSDLKNSYSWTTYEDDNPKVTGEPDSTLLNRKEGYEVLYFINKLMNKWSLKQVSSGQKIEKLIHLSPSELRSQKNIMDWIYNNWKN